MLYEVITQFFNVIGLKIGEGFVQFAFGIFGKSIVNQVTHLFIGDCINLCTKYRIQVNLRFYQIYTLVV